MKKFVPIALLLCVLLSLSSFAPVHKPAFAIKSGKFVTWPITGTVQGSPGTMTYTVDGSGTTPSSITFYLQSTGTYIVSRPFTLTSSNEWIADDLKTTTGITAVIYHNTNSTPGGYALTFISPY
ncbi:MAG TPA: hypothetical protein VFS25_11125 [Chitinophaga sp.]|uniref:hypothetical protein n=1 Tax=Chitinophaga sp. TaxID=1869181 RepID=UPI002DB562BD|nr:hypothetical protein [Chitinophaga sp.]HEU4553381.1 hypothetical protein [Chitinophaga sp.]